MDGILVWILKLEAYMKKTFYRGDMGLHLLGALQDKCLQGLQAMLAQFLIRISRVFQHLGRHSPQLFAESVASLTAGTSL